MTILLTGTHLTPALATIQALRRKAPSARLVYVGREHTGVVKSVEKREVEAVGAEFRSLVFGKIHRHLTLRQASEFLKMPRGLAAAVRLIKEIKPSAVVSFGGYISFPLAVTAALFGVPIVVHEQAAVGGAANRVVRKWARFYAVGWKNLAVRDAIFTGNPIRGEVINAAKMKLHSLRRRRTGRRLKAVYITGGNQGSETIDNAAAPILPALSEQFEVYHQTKRKSRFFHRNYHCRGWFSTGDHAKILAKTAVSVSRAGANTVSELAYLGIPAVLIPLPRSAGGEQAKNAGLLVKTGLAEVLVQDRLTPDKLRSAIERAAKLSDRKVEKAAAKARLLAPADAALKLADLAIKAGSGDEKKQS